jgi:hypothetical protein
MRGVGIAVVVSVLLIGLIGGAWVREQDQVVHRDVAARHEVEVQSGSIIYLISELKNDACLMMFKVFVSRVIRAPDYEYEYPFIVEKLQRIPDLIPEEPHAVKQLGAHAIPRYLVSWENYGPSAVSVSGDEITLLTECSLRRLGIDVVWGFKHTPFHELDIESRRMADIGEGKPERDKSRIRNSIRTAYRKESQGADNLRVNFDPSSLIGLHLVQLAAYGQEGKIGNPCGYCGRNEQGYGEYTDMTRPARHNPLISAVLGFLCLCLGTISLYAAFKSTEYADDCGFTDSWWGWLPLWFFLGLGFFLAFHGVLSLLSASLG